jgi:hypothetical protein
MCEGLKRDMVFCALAVFSFGLTAAQNLVTGNEILSGDIITEDSMVAADSDAVFETPLPLFEVSLLTPPEEVLSARKNLIENYSFEPTERTPVESFWRSDVWRIDGDFTEFCCLRGEDLQEDSALRGLRATDGDFFGYIKNREKNDARFLGVVAVTPGAYYRLSGFVAAAVKGEGTSGATLGIFNGVNTTPIRNTGGQWVPQELFFRVGESQNFVEVALRLGFFGADVQGEAAFDDVRLELVQPDEIPAGVTVLNLPQDEAVSVQTTKIQAAEIARKATPGALLVGIGAFVFAAAATLVLLMWLDGADSRRQEERSQRLEK